MGKVIIYKESIYLLYKRLYGHKLFIPRQKTADGNYIKKGTRGLKSDGGGGGVMRHFLQCDG